MTGSLWNTRKRVTRGYFEIVGVTGAWHCGVFMQDAATPHQRLLLDRQSSIGIIAQMNEFQNTESSLFGVSTVAFVSVEIRGLQGIHA